MSRRFDKVRKTLPQDAENRLAQWIREVNDLTDDSARKTGETVLENLQNDEQFEDAPYREFVAALAASEPTEDCNVRYKNACENFQKRGPESRIPKTLSLHRLMNKERLLGAIARKNGLSDTDKAEYYDILMNPSLTEESSRKAELSGVLIGAPAAGMIWGGFSQNLTDADPLDGLNASEAKAVLGLGEDWYPPGEEVVHLKFRPPEETVRHVPTVADAGWNPYWMPAKADTGFGLTRHLGKPGKTPGRGEVVLDNGTMDWLVSPLIPLPVPED